MQIILQSNAWKKVGPPSHGTKATDEFHNSAERPMNLGRGGR